MEDMKHAPHGVVLVALLGACTPATGRSTAPPGRHEATSTPRPEPAAPCPAIDYAALEPTPQVDARTIELTRVFQREEARDQVVTVPAPLDLDVMHIRRPMPGSQLGGGIGLGWMSLQASWVASATSPEIEASLATWLAAREALGEHQRGSYLLDTRARYVKSVEPPAAWGGRRCVEEAAAQADRDESEAEAATKRAAEALQGGLEALASPRPGDELLLGYLLEAQLPYPYEPKDAERAMGLYAKVASSKAVASELRARAAEQLARIHGPRSEAFVDALERVLSLTKDPELTVETLVKLADVADLDGDAAKAEALRVKLMARLGPQEQERWRVAHTLAELAAARLDRGAYELALDDAARCARESAGEIEHDPDPWSCAPVLAEALAELAQAPAGVAVPLAFLGPLSLASMESALARRDHQQAEHVGKLLLAELPAAAEAPAVVAMLLGIVASDDERATLAAMHQREHGPKSTWTEQQRRRLAWEHEPAAVEQQLAALREPSRPPVVLRLPTKPIELTAELRARATMVGEACVTTLPKGRRAVRVGVETSGTRPIVTVSGAKPAAKACLLRAAGARFRSVGPVQITFGLALE